ncbi:unnamed protein product [Coregonus sp. 'balchen']|nr:unnamed protein product [Coregonus sp. 'balchen']
MPIFYSYTPVISKPKPVNYLARTGRILVRELAVLNTQDTLCNEELIELSNSGSSGSQFYGSSDDQFLINTVQHNEAEFLQQLLPGYFMNLHQNMRSLPKFCGLCCVQAGGKNIRITVMNNLLPLACTSSTT